ncbi:MAG: anti-sigma factor [Sporichthyaceae bacterium]
MAHADPELLALLALGEDVDAAVADHVRDCAACAQDLDGLREVVAVGRAIEPADTPIAPDPDLWRRISAALAEPVAAASPAFQPSGPPPVPASAVPAPAVSAPAATVLALPRRRRTGLVAVAAGVVGLAVGLAFAGLPSLLDEDTAPSAAPTAPPGEVVLARATLAPLPDRSLGGTAAVVAADGGRVLQLRLAGSLPGEGYREVWLLTPDAKGLVSLGALPSVEADIALPAGLDLAAFPIVDVSQEVFDGNPAHSADSLSRGTLG